MTTGIVIASYQYGHLAAHAIETVLDQTRPFDKIWFVDDGVGDCTHLPELYPDVNYVLRTKRLGTVANFQDMLMNHVDTDRVMFMGADNWIRGDTVEQLTEYGTDIVMYDILVVGDRKKEIQHRHPGETFDYDGGLYWHRDGQHHGSMLYNVAKAKAVGGYESPPGRTLEDMVLYHKLLNAGASYKHLQKPLLFYRRHRSNFNKC